MEIARHWRLKQQRYRLIGEECPHCEEKIFPPRDICPRCGGGTLKNNLDIRVINGTQMVGVMDNQKLGK